MSEKKFHVVFSGQIVEGESIPKVKERMAALFKTSAESIEALFNRKNSAIKKNIDEETAEKYVQMIKRTGAICRIIPAESPAPPPPAEQAKAPAPQPAKAPAPAAMPAEGEKEPERSGPLVVAIQLIHKADQGFAPHTVMKISKSGDALNFNKMEVPESSYKQLIAMAVYRQLEDGQEKNKLLLFSDVSKRPLACNAENIDYASFSIDGSKSITASFRNFLYFLCRQNPSIFVEESTFDFLSGSTMQKFDPNGVLKLATNMGKLIESGEMASQT